MCVKIETRPKSGDPAIVKCYKHFVKCASLDSSKAPYWATPHMYTPIPDDGWLFAAGERKFSDYVEAGAIHAYELSSVFKIREYFLKSYGIQKIEIAYAFGVFGYGNVMIGEREQQYIFASTLVCGALYVPEMDKTSQKDRRLALIEQLEGNPELSDQEMRLLHPELKNNLERYEEN